MLRPTKSKLQDGGWVSPKKKKKDPAKRTVAAIHREFLIYHFIP